MSYLFLSYSKSDRDSAFEICDVLRKEGFFVWMNENTDELSHRWYWSRIQRNIQNAGAFVILVSEAAKESAVVKRELDYAEKIKKPIIPILLEGEGWSRLGMEAAKLGLGLHLDISDEMVQQIKNHFPTNPDRATPPQIQPFPLPKLEQKNLFLGISLIAIFLVALLRFSPLLQNLGIVQVESSATPTVTPSATTTNTPKPPRLNSEQIMATLDTLNREMKETQAFMTVQPTIEAAIEATSVAATGTYQASVQLTAAAGNGTLPCWANIPAGFRMNSIKIYVEPSLDASWMQSSMILDIDHLLITEWIITEQGNWYRVGRQSQLYIGYVPVEELEPDPNCPR